CAHRGTQPFPPRRSSDLPGDRLLVDQYEGKVIAVTARTTLLMTLDGNELSLPNGLVFRSVVTNFTANPKRRFDFSLPVDPGESRSEEHTSELQSRENLVC